MNMPTVPTVGSKPVSSDLGAGGYILPSFFATNSDHTALFAVTISILNPHDNR